MTHRTYLLTAAIACLVFLAAIAGINWFVDPDDLFGNNWTGIYVDNDRYAKRRLIKTFPHDALLMGSSKVATIDPADLTGYTYFNASMVGVVPEEMLAFLHNNTNGVRRVLLGLDFYMFNERESPFVETPDQTPRGTSDPISYLLSFTILQASLDSAIKRLSGEPPLVRENGQRDPTARIRADAAFDTPQYEKALKFLRETHYAKFRYSTRRLSVLKNIKALMAKRGIRLTVFINPLNERVLQLIRSGTIDQDFQRFRADVAAIFPDVHDFSDSRWSAPENFYFSDPWHYRENVGAAMLNEIDNCPADRGPARADCPPKRDASSANL